MTPVWAVHSFPQRTLGLSWRAGIQRCPGRDHQQTPWTAGREGGEGGIMGDGGVSVKDKDGKKGIL